MTPDLAAVPNTDPIEAPKATEPRDYTVFMLVEHEGHNPAWEAIDDVCALNRNDALEQAVMELPKDEQRGTFVAIATRYWKPSVPVVETVVKRTWV